MTTTPITPARLREIAELCEEIDGPAYDSIIPDLLTEIARLTNERDRAMADAAQARFFLNDAHDAADDASLGLNARIAALETGLREACDCISNSALHDEEQLRRLRAIADGDDA